MPGIAGIVSQNQIDHSALFSSMLESLNHFNYQVNSTTKGGIYFGNIHLGYLNTKSDFLFSNDKRFLIAFSGEIYSYKTIETSQIEDDQSFFLAQFIQDGPDCLKCFNGHYNAAIYDFIEEKLFLISDRMGTRPLYYAHVINSLIFAPEVKAILKSDSIKEIDYHSISELFSFGHLFGHKTLFEGVNQLPESSYLVYSKGNISIHKYWELPEYDTAYSLTWPNSRKIEQYNDEFIEVFTTAMKRNFTKNRDKILLSLSGGLDSRYVAAYAKHFEINPLISFTMGSDKSEDQIYSKQVAEKLGIEHNAFEVKPQNIWRDAERFGRFSDNMSMIYGPIQGFEALEHFYKKSQVTVSSQMCDALFGSTLWRKRHQILIHKNKIDVEATQIITNIFRLFDDNQLQLIFTKDFYSKIKGRYKEVPEKYINSTKIPIHAYFNLLMNEHGRRGTLSGNLMNNLYMETRMPSYDNDVIDFAYRLPLKMKEYQYLYRKSFVTMFPDLSKIKREHYHLPIDASIRQYKLSILESKISSLIKSSKLNPLIKHVKRYNMPSYINYNEWFKKDLYSEMVSIILDEKTLSRGIYNKDGLVKLINLHKDPRNNYARLLWQVINLEYFFRNNID